MKINEINPPARKPIAPCTPKLLVTSSAAVARVVCRRSDVDFPEFLPPGAGAEAGGDSAVERWLTVRKTAAGRRGFLESVLGIGRSETIEDSAGSG
jgi:hypothetical protein